MADIDSLSSQIKQRMQISAEQQNTIEHYKRMEIQWGLEKTSLEQAEASVRAQLAQTEEDLGYQIQAQEKSIQHAKETLGQTENTLNNRLLLLEKELTASQAATMAQEREVTRLKRELADRENVIAQLRSALDARREAELRLEKQVAAERMQRDQQYREMQDTQAKTEHRHSQALAGLQDEIDKARQEWELERHRIYTRVEEERLNWDRKEANYVSNLEKAEREAEAAASSLQVCSLVCVCVCDNMPLVAAVDNLSAVPGQRLTDRGTTSGCRAEALRDNGEGESRRTLTASNTRACCAGVRTLVRISLRSGNPEVPALGVQDKSWFCHCAVASLAPPRHLRLWWWWWWRRAWQQKKSSGRQRV